MKRSHLGFVLTSLLLGACAHAPPRAPAMAADDTSFQMAEPPALPGLEEDAVAEAERLRPGDVLSVKYVGNKDVEPLHAMIDRGGAVHLPLVGDVILAERTMNEAERLVQDALRHYDKFSLASLELVDAKARVATVTGAVERPGNVPIIGDPHVTDVLGAVGGGKMVSVGTDRSVPFGDLEGARLMRNGVRVPIDVKLAMEGLPRHNVRVRPGDVIVVPPALDGRIIVLGHVAKPQTIAYRRGLRLLEILADCGGLSKDADSEDIRVLRGGYAHPKLYVANAKDVLAGRRPDVVLAPGDVIYVTEHWLGSVGDVLERVIPTAATAGLLLLPIR
jgi:polysaccharide export outer membrane protein